MSNIRAHAALRAPPIPTAAVAPPGGLAAVALAAPAAPLAVDASGSWEPLPLGRRRGIAENREARGRSAAKTEKP